jgi:apolipoprotein N-acyltransferase
MNEAHYFVLFFTILSFGWIGYSAGDDPDKGKVVPLMMFFVGSAIMGVAAVLNLAFLLGKNF